MKCPHKVLEYYQAIEIEDRLNSSFVIGTCLRCNAATLLDRNYELVDNCNDKRYFMRSVEND